jgi:hypothetical protein
MASSLKPVIFKQESMGSKSELPNHRHVKPAKKTDKLEPKGNGSNSTFNLYRLKVNTTDSGGKEKA